MEKIDQKFDPLTGLATTSWLDEDGNMLVDYKQDAAPAFEMVKQARHDGEGWRKGMKKSFVHAFHIPDGVIHELLKHGVNVYQNPSFADIAAGLKKIGRFEACDLTGKTLV